LFGWTDIKENIQQIGGTERSRDCSKKVWNWSEKRKDFIRAENGNYKNFG
jgi:hypothetical protein